MRKPVLAGVSESQFESHRTGKPTTTSRGLGGARARARRGAARRGGEGYRVMSHHIPLSEQVETTVREVSGCHSVRYCKRTKNRYFADVVGISAPLALDHTLFSEGAR